MAARSRSANAQTAPAAADFVVKEFRAIEGGNQMLDRLERHLTPM